MIAGDPEWLDANNRYLAASLEWLRARLAPAPAEPPWPGTVTVPQKRNWYGIGTTAAPAPYALPSPAGAAQADTAAARDEAAQMSPPAALLMLAERLSLTPFERDTLLLAAAPELEPDILAALGKPGTPPPAPNFALALRTLDEPSWDALSPGRPLRQARLVELPQPLGGPLVTAPLRADERIVHYLKGLNTLDERLNAVLEPLPTRSAVLAPSQQAVVDAILHQLQAAGAESRVPHVVLVGADAGSQRDVARAIGDALGRTVYRLVLEALPTTPAELEPVLRLWQRERLLLPIALLIDAHDLGSSSPEVQRLFHTLLARDIGPAFVSLREPLAGGVGDALIFAVAKPTAPEQFAAWQAAFTPADAPETEAEAPANDTQSDAKAARLAGQFDLNLADIAHARALAGLAPADVPAEAALWQACRQLAQPQLDQLAQRIEPRATWDDLVLGDEATRLLRQITAQARNRYKVYQSWGYAQRMTRGLGISALFAGESGTGKTMAAEVIANALDLALYRIDLSAIVSKYIGETEKNLSRLFDAAERGGAILLFDEADALFGKRSEVKDSHDRYANIEINYLLQRMEAFSGLAILATNMKSALDTAFMRRLRFLVNFPYPGLAERERMWRRALPDTLPVGELDYARLSRFALSGGNIHSVALNAAFDAADKDVPLSQGVLLAAVRTELRKLDKPVNEAEFR